MTDQIHGNDQTTEAILEAAELCILEGDLPNVTMEAIAKQANVARRTIYRKFNSKEAVLAELFKKHLFTSIFTKVRTRIENLDLEESIVRGNVLTVQLVKKDPLLSEIIRKGGAKWFQKHLTDSNSKVYAQIRTGTIKMWQEKLDSLRAKGELSPDLTNEEIVDWFSHVNYSFIVKRGSNLADQAEMIRKFVVPAFQND